MQVTVCLRTFQNRLNLSRNHQLSTWCGPLKQKHQILVNLLITEYRGALVSKRQHLGFDAYIFLMLVRTADHQLGQT
jgi:hypothetical protein